jgi:hypothetical protein
LRLRVVVVVAGIVFTPLVGVGVEACGWDWTVVPKEETDAQEAGPTEAGADAGPEGGTNGAKCRSSDECAPDHYCFFEDGLCGAGEVGFCDQVLVCNKPGSLACGCDGRLYDDQCKALAARNDISAEGCTPPPGYFRCGYFFCNESSFCILNNGQCVPWSICEQRGCDCAEQAAKCTQKAICEVDDGGAIKITCPK